MTPSETSLWRLLFSVIWRGLLALVVFGAGFGAMMGGAELSGHDLSADGILAKAYYSMGLFVLGGLDLGTPVGGPVVTQGLLWFAYFAAPLLTAGAILEALVRAIAPHLAKRSRMSQHIVIVGLGQLGRLYHTVVQGVEPGRKLVLVDSNPTALEALGDLGKNAHIVVGDIRNPDIRRQLFLESAVAVMLMTGNDLTNLEAAGDIGDEYPHLKTRIVLHLSDIEMKRRISGQLRRERHEVGGATMIMKISGPDRIQAKESDGVLPIPLGQIFNSRRIAAGHLVTKVMKPHFEMTEPLDCVVLAGLGRFGSAILELLQRELTGEFNLVVVVDQNAELRVRQFVSQVGVHPGYRLDYVDADATDPQTWEKVDEKLRRHPSGKEPVIVLGTGDATANLRMALALSAERPGARILVRSFEVSNFTEKLAQHSGFQVFGVGTLLAHSLVERHQKWFG